MNYKRTLLTAIFIFGVTEAYAMDPNGAQGIIDGLIPHSNFGNYSDFGCEMGTIDFYDHIEFVGDRDNAINSYPLVTPSFGTWMEESFKWFFCTFKNSNVNENFRAIYFKYVAESNEIKIELNIRTMGARHERLVDELAKNGINAESSNDIPWTVVVKIGANRTQKINELFDILNAYLAREYSQEIPAPTLGQMKDKVRRAIRELP